MTTAPARRPAWRVSSHSGGNGDCVQVACPAADTVAVRDSRDPGGPLLVVTAGQWVAFIGALKQDPVRSLP